MAGLLARGNEFPDILDGMKDLRKTLKPKLHTEMFINSSMKNQTENVFNERVMNTINQCIIFQ